MFPTLIPMLISSIKDLVIDKAQSLAEEHVEAALDKHLPPEAKEALDKVIEEDASHGAKSLKEFFKL